MLQEYMARIKLEDEHGTIAALLRRLNMRWLGDHASAGTELLTDLEGVAPALNDVADAARTFAAFAELPVAQWVPDAEEQTEVRVVGGSTPARGPTPRCPRRPPARVRRP